MTLGTIFHGLRHLLGAGFYTHPSLRYLLDPSLSIPPAVNPDTAEIAQMLADLEQMELRELLEAWADQGQVAWFIARGLAWFTLLRLLVWFAQGWDFLLQQ